MRKTELRKTFLARQKRLSSDERREKTASVVQKLFAEFDFSSKHFVNCFVTLEKNNELDSFEIFQKLWREFPAITTTAPRINFEMNALENVRVSPATKFVANKWNILEPEEDDFIETAKLDVVLIPLIAFDARGFRVGYGKGFYDKFLIKCRPDCRKIGLSLFPPVEKVADNEVWDVPLDLCVTPERIWNFK
jgi:5-formyltetrahydrofolate cyclo-ligase